MPKDKLEASAPRFSVPLNPEKGDLAEDNDRREAPESEQRAMTPEDAVVDAFVTGLYRKFKEWCRREFSSDDVTWCEVRAEVQTLLAAAIESAVKDERERCQVLSPFEKIAADLMAACIDDWVHRREISSRSKLADIRLGYGDPFSRERVEQLLSRRRKAPSDG